MTEAPIFSYLLTRPSADTQFGVHVHDLGEGALSVVCIDEYIRQAHSIYVCLLPNEELEIEGERHPDAFEGVETLITQCANWLDCHEIDLAPLEDVLLEHFALTLSGQLS